MRFRFLIPLCCLVVVLTEAQPAKPESASRPTSSNIQKLIGAWQLVSVETVGPHGEVTYPYYGKHPEGLLVYDRSGWMSVQIVSDPKPDAPSIDSRSAILAATPEQKTSIIEGYYAYFGKWTVDPSGSTQPCHG